MNLQRRFVYWFSPMSLTIVLLIGLFVSLNQGSAKAIEQDIVAGSETAVITPTEAITVTLLGSYASPGGETAAEIVAYDPVSQTMYVVNAISATVDVIDISQPVTPTLLRQIDLTPYGSQANSVAFHGEYAAAAVQKVVPQDLGVAVFFDRQGNFVYSATVGALPDMITFSPDGNYVLVANEGEPDVTDPDGSVSIIDISAGVPVASVATADFTAWNGQEDALRALGVRIFPGNTTSQDVEPEYIAVSADSTTAFVTLQEANALAVVDIATATVTDIVPLGVKDHNLPGNGLDASDDDGIINIQNWPVYGMFLPDAITSYEVNGRSYYITANEGDDRGETARVNSLTLDATAFPNAATLQLNENLGRLNVSEINGDTDNDGDYDALWSYGSRSFTIWDDAGSLVFDSGDALEQITAVETPALFNADNGDPADFDTRSDNKGPEPESVVVGQLGCAVYAFVGLERAGGGVVIYDVTNPAAPVPVAYEPAAEGDVSPEGLKFVPAVESPTGEALLLVANEISGTTTIYQLEALSPCSIYLPVMSNP